MDTQQGADPVTITTAPARPAVPSPIPLPALQPIPAATDTGAAAKLRAVDLTIRYGPRVAVRDVTLDVPSNSVMAFIGPSGCGKSTVLRCFDRMNDLIPGAVVSGTVELDGEDMYASDVLPVEVRRKVGLVFQRPNPFPMS